MTRLRTRSFARPSCSPSSPCVTLNLFRFRFLCDAPSFLMPPETQDDTFVISSSTALGMGEYTLALLNIIIQNLPESELRRMRDALYHSVSLADDLLYNISISSTFDVLTINDGICVLLSVFRCFLLISKSLCPPQCQRHRRNFRGLPHPWQVHHCDFYCGFSLSVFPLTTYCHPEDYRSTPVACFHGRYRYARERIYLVDLYEGYRPQLPRCGLQQVLRSQKCRCWIQKVYCPRIWCHCLSAPSCWTTRLH